MSLSIYKNFFVVSLLVLITALGLPKLGFEDNYRDIFTTKNPLYINLDELFETFRSDEGDLYLLVEGKELPTKTGILAVRDLVAELSLLDGLDSIISFLDARKPDGNFEPIFPDEEANEKEFEKAWLEAASNNPFSGQLISKNKDAALILLSYPNISSSLEELEILYEEIELAIEEAIGSSPLSVQLTGFPFMRVEIIQTLKRDQVIFAALGAFLGCSLAWFLFKHWVPVTIIALTSGLGIASSLGVLGALGGSINVINTVLPALILVISIADAMHLLSGYRNRLVSGLSHEKALKGSLSLVRKACIITSLTTAIAFLSLWLSSVAIIRDFGLIAALSSMVCLLAVLFCVPLLLETKLGKIWRSSLTQKKGVPKTPERPFVFEPLLSRFILKSPRALSVGAVFISFLLLALCLKLDTSYSQSESLPTSNPSSQALLRVEQSFVGTLPIRVMVSWKEDRLEREVIKVLESLELFFKEQEITGQAFSILNFLDEETNFSSLKEAIPKNLAAKMHKPELRKTLLSSHMKEVPGSKKQAMIKDLEKLSLELSERHPEIDIKLAGLALISSNKSASMISDLARSLALAFPLIFLTITIATGSLKLGLASIVPNVLPLAAIGGGMFLLDQPLQYSSVIVFCICLGIAVDDSVHFLAHYQKQRLSGLSSREAIEKTFRVVGRVLFYTSLILVMGLSALLWSGLPSVRLFGLLACLSIALAFLSDILVLPAILYCLDKGDIEE